MTTVSKKYVVCPKCNGSGIEDKYIGDGKHTNITCSYCNGGRVVLEDIKHFAIDELTVGGI